MGIEKMINRYSLTLTTQEGKEKLIARTEQPLTVKQRELIERNKKQIAAELRRRQATQDTKNMKEE